MKERRLVNMTDWLFIDRCWMMLVPKWMPMAMKMKAVQKGKTSKARHQRQRPRQRLWSISKAHIGLGRYHDTRISPLKIWSIGGIHKCSRLSAAYGVPIKTKTPPRAFARRCRSHNCCCVSRSHLLQTHCSNTRKPKLHGLLAGALYVWPLVCHPWETEEIQWELVQKSHEDGSKYSETVDGWNPALVDR